MLMRPRSLVFHIAAIIVEQATVVLVPAFCVWWAIVSLGGSHAVAAIFALSVGFIVWAVVWSAAEIADP
ncbi:hypothetical protein [Sphingomonas montanisoli]|uniref:Uncharacterized protein n=1 Tax=Sphingomonas montanisoli TaxID=2606412 RepID=A0A5D9CAS5_9SPHN|nr:hypothetical protein [Sphingomonas montanisoli]TZG27145.1 hypothetical protein FYJ91_05820 [Sphingomonas montanisoli]